MASIKEGRLFAQLYRLIRADEPCALLLEGTTADLVGSQMRREAIQGALLQITLFMQIPVLRSLHPAESVYLLLMAARHLQAIGAPRKPGLATYNSETPLSR